GPRKFTRRSFTGTPPHSSFRAGTTIASFGSFGYRGWRRRNGIRIQHGWTEREPIASRNATAGWLCPIARAFAPITFAYGHACPWANPTSPRTNPGGARNFTYRGTI